MSGYSAIMFVAFAAVAYDYGLAMHVWWALTIGLGVGIGAFAWAARWNRLRAKRGVASPLEYLARRYNLPAQQVLAYSGALLKAVGIAAKRVAIAVPLTGFAGIPIRWAILLTGLVTLVYITVGGLWADVLTDFGQFVIQGLAGVAMLIAVMAHLDGVATLWTMWDRLPEGHGEPFAGPYTTTLFIALLFIKTFEHNGGMRNLAQRYMASPTGAAARRPAEGTAGRRGDAFRYRSLSRTPPLATPGFSISVEDDAHGFRPGFEDPRFRHGRHELPALVQSASRQQLDGDVRHNVL